MINKPYAESVVKGAFMFISGQSSPINADSCDLESFHEEARQVLAKVKSIIVGSGKDMQDIAKVNVYITDMKYFNIFNKVYSEFFRSTFPARTCVQVNSLPMGARVEVDVISQI